MADVRGQITRLLGDLRAGNTRASEELLPLVYGELRELARARLAGEKHRYLHQPTSLVHEVYVRLVGDADLRWDGRAHFFASAAEAMRRILIEEARRRARVRHGGRRRRVELGDDVARVDPPGEDVLAVDAALSKLEALDRSMSDVVKLRYYGGMTVDEVARALETSPRSVNRLWTAARAWLHREISGGAPPSALS